MHRSTEHVPHVQVEADKREAAQKALVARLTAQNKVFLQMKSAGSIATQDIRSQLGAAVRA